MASKRAQRRKEVRQNKERVIKLETFYARSCIGKQKHKTKNAAIAHKIHLQKKDGSRMHAYHCTNCNHWHVAHSEVKI